MTEHEQNEELFRLTDTGDVLPNADDIFDDTWWKQLSSPDKDLFDLMASADGVAMDQFAYSTHTEEHATAQERASENTSLELRKLCDQVEVLQDELQANKIHIESIKETVHKHSTTLARLDTSVRLLHDWINSISQMLANTLNIKVPSQTEKQ